MNKPEEYSSAQLRKIRHLKIFIFIVAAFALLGVVYLLLPLGPYVLALAGFAFLVMLFFASTSKLLDRVATSVPRGEGGKRSDELA
jgi:hypothetical protein